jgi:hypothetical protein
MTFVFDIYGSESHKSISVLLCEAQGRALCRMIAQAEIYTARLPVHRQDGLAGCKADAGT